MDSDAILIIPAFQSIMEVNATKHHGKFNMAEDTLRRSCQSGKDSYLFDLAGDNVKWKTISLTHVEYPEGNNIIFLDLCRLFLAPSTRYWICCKHVKFLSQMWYGYISPQGKTSSCHFSLYVTGDITGKILAWCSLLPIFIVVGFITLIIFRREVHTVGWFIFNVWTVIEIRKRGRL